MEAVQKLVFKQFAIVEIVLEDYRKNYFGNLAGAKCSVKDHGAVSDATRNRKISSVRKILNFLVQDGDQEKESVPELLEHLEALGREDDGYFAKLNYRVSSVTQLSHLKEFITFMRTQKYIGRSLFDKCTWMIGNMRWNLSRNGGLHRAKFQEEEKSKMVSAKDFESFDNSPLCKKAERLLQTKPGLMDVKMRDYTLTRNYLITRFVIDDLLRPCALYALPAAQFTATTLKPDRNGLYHFPLYYDKTVGATGMANYLHLTGATFNHFCPALKL